MHLARCACVQGHLTQRQASRPCSGMPTEPSAAVLCLSGAPCSHAGVVLAPPPEPEPTLLAALAGRGIVPALVAALRVSCPCRLPVEAA